MADILLFLSLAIALAVAFFLYKKKWNIKHVISLFMGFVFIFVFSTYGSSILKPVFPGINAALFFLIIFIIIYIGGAFVGSLPFLIHGDFKKQKHKIINLFKIFLVFGLVYTAVDNFTMGPFAAGPNSPYIGKSLCSLDATYYSEDVFFGCLLEKLMINPYSNLAAFIVYNVLSLVLILSAGRIIGFRRLEGLMYPERIDDRSF